MAAFSQAAETQDHTARSAAKSASAGLDLGRALRETCMRSALAVCIAKPFPLPQPSAARDALPEVPVPGPAHTPPGFPPDRSRLGARPCVQPHSSPPCLSSGEPPGTPPLANETLQPRAPAPGGHPALKSPVRGGPGKQACSGGPPPAARLQASACATCARRELRRALRRRPRRAPLHPRLRSFLLTSSRRSQRSRPAQSGDEAGAARVGAGASGAGLGARRPADPQPSARTPAAAASTPPRAPCAACRTAWRQPPRRRTCAKRSSRRASLRVREALFLARRASSWSAMFFSRIFSAFCLWIASISTRLFLYTLPFTCRCEEGGTGGASGGECVGVGQTVSERATAAAAVQQSRPESRPAAAAG